MVTYNTVPLGVVGLEGLLFLPGQLSAHGQELAYEVVLCKTLPLRLLLTTLVHFLPGARQFTWFKSQFKPHNIKLVEFPPSTHCLFLECKVIMRSVMREVTLSARIHSDCCFTDQNEAGLDFGG